jgi:hypothetical protein
VSLSNCIFADNDVTAQLILASSGTNHLNLSNCTLTHDLIGGPQVFSASDVFGLYDSIVNEGSIPALAFSGSAANLGVQYDLADNTAGLPADPTILAGSPTFIDAAHGDYRLSVVRLGGTVIASLGVDFAPAAGGTDIRGWARDQDLVGVDNRLGTRDLGAYEMQPIADRIFADAFGDAVARVY